MGAVVTRMRHLQELLTVIPPWTHDYRECFRKLAESCRTKIYLTRDPTDTKEAIKLSIVTRLNSSRQYIIVQCGHFLAHLIRPAFVKLTISMNLLVSSQVSSWTNTL